ncbi:MAG: hypothetical protein IJI49_05900 [Bacilli bacterium]|nr:hypothetical protein [Bacilli bacterium]
MIEYANETVIKALKQYDMLFKSLKFITDLKQKQDIGEQMTKIIQRVLNITNSIYENKYMKIYNKSTFLMDEERNRLLELINLINERRTYINNQINNNYEVTGISFASGSILGEDKLDSFKERVKIIDKYKNNIKQDGVLKDELDHLDISIRKANNKISSNKVLNRQLESKLIRILDNAFEKLSLYELKEREKEIDLAYTELGYSLEKAKENAKIARSDCTQEIIIECDNMLSAITLEYERYKEKKLILRLLEIYNKPTLNYDELLNKREEINSILSGIVGSELYAEVGEELNKQYATIKLEKQDMATLKSLMEEKKIKMSALEEIKKENDSEEFREALADLLENERKHQEELLLIKKKEEEKQRLIELEKEKKRREEIIRRQKVLEEERNKEIEERTKRLLDEKKTSVLTTSKDKKEEVQLNSLKEKVEINRKVDEGIPVVKNNNYSNNVVNVKKVSREEDVFPKVKLDKKEDIFPAFPNINKEDAFFDENELDDLNKDANDDGNNKWF